MSGDARDFNNIETRAVINFFFLLGEAPKEIHAILTETLGEHAPSYFTVKNWVAQFKRGDIYICDASRPGRPIAAAENWLYGQPSEFFFERLAKVRATS